MCCFSGTVNWVARTRIFARPGRDERQLLVYAMSFEAAEELAMILPLPVPKGSPERALRFISFKEYPDFFRDLAAGFPRSRSPAKGGAGGVARPAAAAPPLEVFDVGSFEASFVPSIADFSRLDGRFRLAEGTWEKLPGYADFGFAVFKLKRGKQTVHPMAFEFPRANRKQVFYPTVHIHDGKVHGTAMFDHELYLQLADANWSPRRDWVESTRPAGMFMQLPKIPGLLDPDLHCYRTQISGPRPNEDVVI